MKNKLLGCLLVLLLIGYNTSTAQQQIQETYYTTNESGVLVEPILYIQDARPSLSTRLPGEDEFLEKDYITNGISNVNIIYRYNTVFISWNVCDDLTKSIFLIQKNTSKFKNKIIGFIGNIPCNPHIPLLYNFEDKDVILNELHVYKLYKLLEDGSMVHIITMILPKTNNQNTASTY